MSGNQTSQFLPNYTNESTSDLLEDSLTCPLCIEMFDTNLETYSQAQTRQPQRAVARRPLLSPESRLPVSCTSCWYTFCNACLHRLMYRPGGIKCPICPQTGLSVAAPSVNIPLVHLLRLIRPMVETPSTDQASNVKVVTPTKKKATTVTKAKKTRIKTKTVSKTKEERLSSIQVGEYGLLSRNVYRVQAIVGRRSCKSEKWYKIRWEGYSEEHDTWESWKNLKHLDIEFRKQMEHLDEQAKKQKKSVIVLD